jgi:hypothetical protein
MSLDATWRKSTRSGNSGSCVEVRCLASAVQVRDTKNRTGPVLCFPAEAWRGFLAGVGDGEFDRR